MGARQPRDVQRRLLADLRRLRHAAAAAAAAAGHPVPGGLLSSGGGGQGSSGGATGAYSSLARVPSSATPSSTGPSRAPSATPRILSRAARPDPPPDGSAARAAQAAAARHIAAAAAAAAAGPVRSSEDSTPGGWSRAPSGADAAPPRSPFPRVRRDGGQGNLQGAVGEGVSVCGEVTEGAGEKRRMKDGLYSRRE